MLEKASMKNLWHYNPLLKTYANKNRNSMTKVEACIWKFLLGGKQMMGYSFRRQRPVLNYIADFLCKDLMLIVEIDGITHQWEEVAQKDEKRTTKLQEIGFTIIRFTDEEVLNDMQNVNRTLTYFIEEFELSLML